ncbi:hypothetical protein CFP65_0055 [Kitasatospora sp. MMS16-BH015]|uniref:helix-turn-helix transcriptional regulator n=1 Tax=Kitasatospora sp. MMS16-BH015 TaxID=2018025 RepID=UPI000CA3141C|nr:AAA family ATPase [Kitasatospora sp. MMS16-BH015]AUG75041.1 hypothetical protein CFP65_0055 [Kitasatospora sp. MMS16-BH015]
MSATALLRWPFIGRRAELERIADAAADPGVRAALVCGPPGTGKSRLVEEYLTQAEAKGLRTARLTGSRTAAAMPLCALAPLLPSPALTVASAPQELFAQVYAYVVAQAGERRFVLGVDDLHLLDAASLALLTALCAAPQVFLVASLRGNEPLPDAFTGWWQAGRALRLDLAELARESTETLLHLTLGAPVSGPAAAALWEASRGNLLYLRELVLGGFADRTLVQREGVWCLAAPLRVSDGVAGLVQERLSGLSPAQRTALERLALCEPLSVDELLTDTPEEQLTGLEAAGLIEVRNSGRRQEVRLAHPLHAAALRAALPRLRARTLLLDQIARVRAHGARRGEDALRLAGWQLDATGTAEPDLLLRAAVLAHYAHDLDRMRQLAQAALRQGFDARAALLMATALGELGCADQAVTVLTPAMDQLGGPDLQSAAVVIAWNCFYGSPGLAAARSWLTRTTARGGPELRLPLGAYEARLLSLAGRTGQARELLTALGLDAAEPDLGGVEPTLGPDSVESPLGLDGIEPAPVPLVSYDLLAEPQLPSSTVQSARTEVIVLAAQFRVLYAEGQLERAAALGRRLFERHSRLPDRSGLSHPAGRLAELASAQLELGEFDLACATLREGRQLALRDRVESLAAWFSLQAGRVELARGRMSRAAAQLREALAHGRAGAARDAELAALAALVIGSAAQGELDAGAVTALRALTADRSVTAPDPCRALAWADALEGRPQQARDRLADTAASALAHGEHTAALAMLHDLARLGGAPAAAAVLAGLPDGLSTPLATGPFAAARTAHIHALATQHAAGLDRAGRALAELGAHLPAAEAWTRAAELHRADGSPRPAAASATRAAEARSRCEGAATPALATPAGTPADTPLTTREREIAWLAARGGTSREVAQGLHLSVRTVENHLQNIYGKLGISGRAQLADALGQPAPSPRKADDHDA